MGKVGKGTTSKGDLRKDIAIGELACWPAAIGLGQKTDFLLPQLLMSRTWMASTKHTR